MKNYELTIEDGMITWIENTDENGNTTPGILSIPQEATSFSADAWVTLGCDTDGICVHKDNPVYSSAHNCLLSKDGTRLIKTSKASDISGLTGLKVIGRDAFQTLAEERSEFVYRIPDGVEVLEYRAFAVAADNVKIIVPASVYFVDLMAFMIHSDHTHIVFEGDPYVEVGTFGTAAEAEDSDFVVYKSLPTVMYPKAENIKVTCQPGGKVSAYCKKYGILEG